MIVYDYSRTIVCILYVVPVKNVHAGLMPLAMRVSVQKSILKNLRIKASWDGNLPLKERCI
jgi:hypothetical protein